MLEELELELELELIEGNSALRPDFPPRSVSGTPQVDYVCAEMS